MLIIGPTPTDRPVPKSINGRFALPEPVIRQSNVTEHRPGPTNDAPRERISDTAPEVRRSLQSCGEEDRFSLKGGEDIDRG